MEPHLPSIKGNAHVELFGPLRHTRVVLHRVVHVQLAREAFRRCSEKRSGRAGKCAVRSFPRSVVVVAHHVEEVDEQQQIVEVVAGANRPVAGR